jgi:hypothetical protein
MEEEPVVGAIYEDQDGQAFEILSFDEDEGTIEVQYADGSVDEIDLDAWYEMDLQPLKTAPWKDEEDEDEEDEKPSPGRQADDEEDDEDLDDYDEEEDDYEE